MSTSGYGGGGLCSAKLTPYGEWKSACYDYDFYDGSSSSPDRVPAGPSVWYSAIWTRDLEQIASTFNSQNGSLPSTLLSLLTMLAPKANTLIFLVLKILESTLSSLDRSTPSRRLPLPLNWPPKRRASSTLTARTTSPSSTSVLLSVSRCSLLSTPTMPLSSWLTPIALNRCNI